MTKKIATKSTSKPKEKDISIEAVGLKIKQSSLDIEFYVLTVPGKIIAEQLGVKRMKWHGKAFTPEGFQRQIDKNRVKAVATYLNNNPPIMPNAIVVSFDKDTLEFTPLPGQTTGSNTILGKVVVKGKLREIDGDWVPMPESERIGYVIDGQHRLEAISESSVDKEGFPVIISAFHDVTTQFQLEQFYALNQTVPISTSQLALLRQQLHFRFEGKEAKKQKVSQLREKLQQMPNSPFEPGKYVKSKIYSGILDVTIIEKMIERAITTTGLKRSWKTDANEITDNALEEIAKGLYVFWKAISETFPDVWGKKPTQQRLFSALGLYSVIDLYDQVMGGINVNSSTAINQAVQKFKIVKDLPWDKMQRLPAAAKAPYIDLLIDALNDLWSAEGKRPFTFVIKMPETGEKLVELELK